MTHTHKHKYRLSYGKLDPSQWFYYWFCDDCVGRSGYCVMAYKPGFWAGTETFTT